MKNLKKNKKNKIKPPRLTLLIFCITLFAKVSVYGCYGFSPPDFPPASDEIQDMQFCV